MARNSIQSKAFRGVTGDMWLMKLEKKAFGWHFWSSATEDQVGFEINSDGTNGHVTHKYIQWLEFRRQAPYSGNILFNLTETLSRIFSFFRRLLISLGMTVLIICLVIGLVFQFGFDSADTAAPLFDVAKWLAIAYAIAAGITFVFAALALLWRKMFKIDDKLKAIYGDDLSDCRFYGEE